MYFQKRIRKKILQTFPLIWLDWIKLTEILVFDCCNFFNRLTHIIQLDWVSRNIGLWLWWSWLMYLWFQVVISTKWFGNVTAFRLVFDWWHKYFKLQLWGTRFIFLSSSIVSNFSHEVVHIELFHCHNASFFFHLLKGASIVSEWLTKTYCWENSTGYSFEFLRILGVVFASALLTENQSTCFT